MLLQMIQHVIEYKFKNIIMKYIYVYLYFQNRVLNIKRENLNWQFYDPQKSRHSLKCIRSKITSFLT